MSVLLEATGLDLAYGPVAVCRDLGFQVMAGEVVALIGANGAGKTTTLRAVAGLLAPRAGTLRFAGQSIDRMPAHARLGLGIALVPEGRRVFPFLTVRENLEMGGFRHRRDRRRLAGLIERGFAWFPRLRERAGQRAGTLSGGEQQMLALARAMMSEPRLLCLDEPSLGLAPIVVQDIFRTIAAINRDGTSILLVEQNAHHAFATAARGYVLRGGTIVAAGPTAALRSDERVRAAYLGGTAGPVPSA